MSERYEGYFYGKHNSELFFQVWKVAEPRGTLVLTHGLAEHSECYHHVATALNQANWNVVAWDLRGHGRSEGKRGYVDSFDDYSEDLIHFWKEIERMEDATEPKILMGHSLGTLIIAKTLLAQPGKINPHAVVLSSPFFGIAIEVPKLKEAAARLATKWMPSLTLWNEIRYEQLTRDESMREAYPNDPLRHDKISPNVFLGFLENQKYVLDHVHEWSIPLLMMVAGQDSIADSEAAVQFFESCPIAQKELKVFGDSYHEILNDLDRDQAIQDLKVFLNAQKRQDPK